MPSAYFANFLEELQARVAIEDVMKRFNRSVDRGDWSLMRRCLHADAAITHGTFAGDAEQFIEWVAPFHDGVEYSQHFDTNVLIDFAGPTQALVEVYVVAFYGYGASGRNPGGAAVGDGFAAMRMQIINRYIDRLEARDGEWRIASHTFLHVDRMVEHLTDPIPSPAGYLSSQRGEGDELYAAAARLGLKSSAFGDASDS